MERLPGTSWWHHFDEASLPTGSAGSTCWSGHLLVRLPAYAVNRTKRLIKSPKLYWGDTGVALHPIEIKATTRPRLADAVHLRTFRAEYGDKARAGLLLHTGDTLGWLTPDVLAVPWWRVL